MRQKNTHRSKLFPPYGGLKPGECGWVRGVWQELEMASSFPHYVERCFVKWLDIFTIGNWKKWDVQMLQDCEYRLVHTSNCHYL